MIITLTIDQAEALFDPLFEEDDALRDYPIPFVGDLGAVTDEDEKLIGYAIAHPELTYEDEIVLHTLLDDRVAVLKGLKKLPAKERPALRAEIRSTLRRDTRKAERVELRISDRQAARVEMRQDLRKDARIAERIAARKAELDAASDL